MRIKISNQIDLLMDTIDDDDDDRISLDLAVLV